MPPWDRAELGDWLQRPDEYDALIFWKLDRLCRSVRDFSTMVEWATTEPGRPFTHHTLPSVDHVKSLISTMGEIDLTTNYGKAMASVVAVFAELEADIIAERVNDARSQLYDEKRWHGGRYPFGYTPEKLETGGYRLAIDPDTHAVLLELIDRMLAGEPAFAVQMDFERRGIPTPKGGKTGWRSVNISGMLRSRALLGEYTFKAITDDGLPGENVRSEPLVPLAKWNALQELLEKNPKRQRVTGAHMLLDVAFCASCGEPMYLRTMRQKKPDGSGHWEYRYLGCGGRWSRRQLDCEAKEAIRAEKVESLIGDMLLEHVGDLEVVRTERVAGVDYSAEIAEQLAQVKSLAATAAALPEDDDLAEVYAELIGERREKIRELRAMPTQEAGWREVPTGQSYREVFEAADTAGKRRLLLDAGIRVEVRKSAEPDVSVILPADDDDSGLEIADDGTRTGRMAVLALGRRAGVQVAMGLPSDIAERANIRPGNEVTWVQRPIPLQGKRSPFTADV